jgi:hypothetical protein
MEGLFWFFSWKKKEEKKAKPFFLFFGFFRLILFDSDFFGFFTS